MSSDKTQYHDREDRCQSRGRSEGAPKLAMQLAENLWQGLQSLKNHSEAQPRQSNRRRRDTA